MCYYCKGEAIRSLEEDNAARLLESEEMKAFVNGRFFVFLDKNTKKY